MKYPSHSPTLTNPHPHPPLVPWFSVRIFVSQVLLTGMLVDVRVPAASANTWVNWLNDKFSFSLTFLSFATHTAWSPHFAWRKRLFLVGMEKIFAPAPCFRANIWWRETFCPGPCLGANILLCHLYLEGTITSAGPEKKFTTHAIIHLVVDCVRLLYKLSVNY